MYFIVVIWYIILGISFYKKCDVKKIYKNIYVVIINILWYNYIFSKKKNLINKFVIINV